MKRSMVIFLLVAALAFAVAADTKGIGTLAGTVIGPSGKPVAGARVTSQGADGTMPKSTLTNERRPLLLSPARERLLRCARVSQRCVDQLEAQHRSENWKANGSEVAAAVPSIKLARVTKVFDEVMQTCANR